MTVIETGPRNARSDPRTGIRTYRWQGRDLPSVTSVRRVAGMPHGLHQWALGRVVDRAVGSFAELGAMLTREARPRERALEANRVKEARAWLRAAATEERDTAAALGTAVHDCAARGLLPRNVPDVVVLVRDGRETEVPGSEVRPRLAQYRDWLDRSGAEVLASECQLWSLSLGYAGTADLVVRMPDGRTLLADIKTGAGVYPEHLLQVLAYSLAEFSGSDDRQDPRATALLAALDGVAVLHLGPDSWEWLELDATAEAWRAFRGLLAFAVWMQAHPDAASVTRSVLRSGDFMEAVA